MGGIRPMMERLQRMRRGAAASEHTQQIAVLRPVSEEKGVRRGGGMGGARDVHGAAKLGGCFNEGLRATVSKCNK